MLHASAAYNVRRAPQDVTDRLVRSAGKCSGARVHVQLQGKTFAQVRRELNAKLAASLAMKRHEAAFAKAFHGCDPRLSG